MIKFKDFTHQTCNFAAFIFSDPVWFFNSFVLIFHMWIKISDHKFVEMYLWGCSSSQPQCHWQEDISLSFGVQNPARWPRSRPLTLPPALWTWASCCQRSDTWGFSWRGASRPTRLCGRDWRSSCSEDPAALKPSTSTTCCPLQVNGKHVLACWWALMDSEGHVGTARSWQVRCFLCLFIFYHS